jgi:hypothetical protein
MVWHVKENAMFGKRLLTTGLAAFAVAAPARADMVIPGGANQLNRFYCIHNSKVYSVGALRIVRLGKNRDERYLWCRYDTVNIPEPEGGGHNDAWVAKWVVDKGP